MKKATHLFLNSDSYHSFSFFSLLFGILLVALPASLSAQVTFTALDDLSVNASIQTGVSGGTPTGGVYSGAGVIDDSNGMTYSFDPAAAGVGVHTLTYTVGVNSASDDVEVLDLTPPAFSKSFDIMEIGPGSVTTLTFTIDNSDSDVGVTDLDFTDNLPAGMTIATPANVTNSCGLGTVTAPDGGTTISYTDGTLGAFSTCTITVDVTSSTPGTHMNTTGNLNSSHGNSGTASANLTVSTNRPGFSKSFSPGSVNFGERSTLTFIIDNSANTNDMLSLNFTDNLPAGMEVASPANIIIGCTGGNLTAEPGSTVITYDYPITFPGGALAAGSTCTISVDVVGTNASTLINVTDNLTGLNSSFQTLSSGKASAALEVMNPTEIFLQKSFNPNPAAPGGTTNLEFTITNFSRDFEATNITFSDDLTTVLAGLAATGTPINDVCGIGSQISGTTNLTFTGGTIPAEGSCTFSVPLSVPAGAAGGIYTNTTNAITGDLDGSTITGNMANEDLTIAYVPTITKEFLIDPIIAGGTTTLEFTITNTDPTNPATDITFTDDLSAFISGATISSLPASGSCGASSVFSYDSFTGVFEMNGGENAAGGSCTFSIDLMIPTNVSSGLYNNTTSFLSSTIDGDIVLGDPASDDLEVLAIPQFTKSFTDDPVDEGDIVNLEFEITYDDFATVDATSISFTDDLNAVISGLAAIGLPINDVCGIGSQLSGTTNLSFTGGTMSPGDICTFSVPVQVPAGTLPGTYSNTTSTLSSTVDGQTGTSNAATDDLLIGGLSLTKEFIDDPTIPGDLVTLRFTIDNTTTENASSIFFTDNLGAVLPGLVAEAPLPTMPCGPSSSISGTSFLVFTNGEVAAGTSCSFDVNVRVPAGTDSGNYNNITSSLVATMNGMSVNLPPATDILEVNDNLIALSKTFTDDPVLPGNTVTVEYTLTNLDPSNAASNIAFTDDFDALLTGLQATGLPMSVCGGTVSGTGLLSFTGGSLAAGASCTFSVTLQTPMNAPYGGSLSCPTSEVTGEINGFSVVGDPASDNLDFQLLQFSKSFAGDIEPGGSTTLTFTITNPDPDNSVNVIRFTDDLDAVVSGMIATNLPLNDICGPGSSVTGTSTIVFDNGTLAPGQSCSFDVIVEIPCESAAGTYLNTTSEINADGNDGDPATDDITVLSATLISFTAPADLCVDAGVQAGLGGGTPTGGVYSGAGVTDNGNGETYSFDPATAGVGVHTLTYTNINGNGCTDSASDDVEVFALPIVNFTALADLCIDAGVQAGLGGGTPTGGVYSGPGVTDDGNGMTYSYDPAAAGAGVHTLTYTYTDGNGCSDLASDDVEVFDLPSVMFTAPDDLCVNSGVQAGLSGGTPTGGVYSGTGVTDDSNGMTYSFDPAGAGTGVHTITYDYTDPNGCSGSASDDVEVYDAPIVTLSTALFYCEDAPIQNIALIGGTPAGGIYSGIGVTDNGNGISYYFDPTVNGPGTVTITYTYTDSNGCTNSDMSDIDIIDCSADNDFEPDDPCQCLDNATIVDLDAGTGGEDGQFSELVTVSNAAGASLPPGMTWTVVGAVGAFDEFNVPPYGTQSAGVPTADDGSVFLAYNAIDGVYELPFVHIDDMGYTLMVEGPFGMGSPANVVLTISNKCQYPDPIFDPVIPDVIDADDPTIILGAMDTNGGMQENVVFMIDGMVETELDPSSYMMGIHTIEMTYDGADDGNGGMSPDGGTTSASPGCIQNVTKDFEIFVCDLIVDCSNIVDSTLACRADLPPVDFNLPIVIDSCGDVIRSALTIIPGNSGCPGDTLTITRTYFLQDTAGNMAECMQTFTIISTMDPVFTFFPNDTTVLCGADTSPAATGMAEGAGECDPATPQATVTFNDVTTPGACPQEMTTVRTWTVTDRCGRMVSMDQTIMVVDTVPPTMVCQNITVELDENGMATADPNDVDNGSSDNCGGPVALSLSMDMFTCDNLGANDVWLIGEDECGNIDSCMAVITVEDNIEPTITCPGDFEMANDLGVCGAIVTFDIVGDDNCGFVISQTAGIPSGGFYPVGETMNTYVITDDAGLTATCSFTVTVNDEEGPMIECPNDIFVQLEAGECEEVVFFDVPFMDNCGSIDAEASQAVNEALVSTALDCAFNTSNHLRYFENSLPVPVEINQVNFGVFNSGVNETVTVNIYMIGPGAPFQYANMVLMGTVDHMVPAGMNQVILTANVEATIPAGMNYVLELKANNTTNFVIGYNTAGETESTYISGNNPVPCVSLEPVDIDVLGFGAFAVILYSDAEGGPAIEQTGGIASGEYYPIGTTTNTFVATDVYGNTTECVFDVTLVEFENGVTGAMACNDNINVSLDLDCQLELNADMLLEGDIYGCYDDYIINVSGGVGSGIITEPGTYTVTITDPDTGNKCWSTINVESKAVPVIDCAGALCPIDMLEGEWTADDNTFSPGAAWAFDGFPPNDNILYDVIQFVVEVPGIYTLTMTPSPDFDGIAGIYADSFDPDMPALNLIGGDDDIPGVFESEPDFMIMLDAGTYFLVSSTWGAGQMGVYTWSFSGPGDLLSNCDVKCYELDALLSGDLDIPLPEVTSCIPYEIYYSDAVDYNDCGTTTVTRTYLAENANGSSTCEVTFEIDPVSVALDIRLPEPLVVLTCNDGTDPADIAAIFDNPLTKDIASTDIIENNEGYIYAYPTYEVNGHPQKVDNNVCNVYAAYTDQELDACAEGCYGNRKIIRTWTLVDWCTLEITNFIQTIKAIDTEAPTLITKDITVSTDAWGCEATFEAPLPWELHDNCDAYPEYRISGPAGVAIDGTFEDGYTIIGAPKGTHTFYYIAYDCCDNEASYPFTVTVLDITPPVVVAKQNVVISLTSGSTSGAGLAKLYAESIDNGSYDGCSSTVKLEVRRDEDNCDVRGNATYNADGHPQDGSPNPNSPSYDPDGGAYVKFCCADLDNAVVDVNGDGELDAGYVKVWLRVWDDGDMDGIFGTAGDNYNEAWAFVKVEDKLAPAITCPPDVTLTCDMDYTDLNMTGSASAFGSCGGVDVEYNDIIVNLNACNEGFVRRRWNVVGRTDIFCDQTITMEDLDMPVNVSFSQVQDFTAANCPDMIALGEPTWIAGPCDVIGYTMETDTFKFEDGACYKLVNYWTVINWCDYDPNNPFWDGSGLWEHVQVIKVTDETKPVLEDCEDKMYAINDHSDSDDDGEVCEAKITLTNVATDPGSDNCPTGWLKWQVFVDLWGDGTDDLEYSSFLPPFDNQFNDTNGNGIGDVYVAPTANGETVSIPLPDIAGSMSNHKVRWKVTDGCNNVTTCDTEFMVVDKKAPTPYCVDLSTAVMESSGTVELWAIDFNVGSFDNCTAQEDLRYTFSNVAPEDDPNYDETQYSSSKVFDCGDVENSPVEVNMYVWDEKGNADFCIVYLTIVDNTGACGGKPEIGGTVATASGEGVNEVQVTLEAALPEYPRTEMTDEEGIYVFLENALNANYQISGSKDVDYMNGVSTLDLVKIQRHILGLEELDSPYKLVAADVNADDQIKASDLTQLRKLILGVITDLPTNESWRFVDGAQNMSMDMNLADIDYTLNLENVQGNSFGNDMVAVKVGDVTNNAVANLANQSTEVRSSKTLELSIENQVVEAGQKVSVDFMSEDFTEVYGYQFTMELNGLSFAGIENGVVVMEEGNVGVLTSNVLTMSYNNTTSISAGNDAAIFSIDFIATESGNLSEMIDITSKVTRSEAYVGQTLEIRDVVITTRGAITTVEATELYQNEPNPFKGQTVVGFNLAEAGAATMTVFDVTGKVIVKENIDGVKGYNTVNFTANQLGISGVLYYTLESGDFTATKKMIIIE